MDVLQSTISCLSYHSFTVISSFAGTVAAAAPLRELRGAVVQYKNGGVPLPYRAGEATHRSLASNGRGSVCPGDAGGTVGRLSETGKRFLSQVRALHGVEQCSAPESSAGQEGMSDRVPTLTASHDHPYECGVCGRRLLTGEDHGRYCVDGRRTIACSLCDIELAAAGFVRVDDPLARSQGSSAELADCA